MILVDTRAPLLSEMEPDEVSALQHGTLLTLVGRDERWPQSWKEGSVVTCWGRKDEYVHAPYDRNVHPTPYTIVPGMRCRFVSGPKGGTKAATGTVHLVRLEYLQLRY